MELSNVVYTAVDCLKLVFLLIVIHSDLEGNPFIMNLKSSVCRVILTIGGLFFDKLEQVFLD